MEERKWRWCASGCMTDDKVYDEASKVSAEGGEVIVDGPDAVDVRLTPEAAEQTGENLTDQAVTARGQRRLSRFTHRPK